MDERVTYVPMLKSKLGEFTALSNLPVEVKDTLCPLFEIGKPETKAQRAKGLDKFLEDTITSISGCWDSEHYCFLDIFNHDLQTRTSNGEHLLTHIFRAANTEGLSAIPVIGLERDQEYERAMKQLKGQGVEQIAVRLLMEDLELGAEETSIDVLAMMERIDIDPAASHLLLDLRCLPDSGDLSNLKTNIIEFIRDFEELADFNSLTLASTAFPSSMGVVKSESITPLPRSEYKLWQQVRDALGEDIGLLFGDYGINHPDMLELDWGKGITPAAKIRYTTEDAWVIFKGGSLKKKRKYAQYFDLASDVTNHACYRGSSFSWGDNQITEKALAQKGTGPGSTTTWVGIDTNHHLTFVSKQLSSSL